MTGKTNGIRGFVVMLRHDDPADGHGDWVECFPNLAIADERYVEAGRDLFAGEGPAASITIGVVLADRVAIVERRRWRGRIEPNPK